MSPKTLAASVVAGLSALAACSAGTGPATGVGNGGGSTQAAAEKTLRLSRNQTEQHPSKIRVQDSPLAIAMVEAMGASATPMAFGEVYTALQSGVIDGTPRPSAAGADYGMSPAFSSSVIRPTRSATRPPAGLRQSS